MFADPPKETTNLYVTPDGDVVDLYPVLLTPEQKKDKTELEKNPLHVLSSAWVNLVARLEKYLKKQEFITLRAVCTHTSSPSGIRLLCKANATSYSSDRSVFVQKTGTELEPVRLAYLDPGVRLEAIELIPALIEGLRTQSAKEIEDSSFALTALTDYMIELEKQSHPVIEVKNAHPTTHSELAESPNPGHIPIDQL
jgi:hypothetical protein